MEAGVTTAIVAFIFVCVIFPTIVRQKPKFYAALACIVLVIFLAGLIGLIHSGAFIAAAYFVICLLQIAAILLLVLAAGGLSLKQLIGEVNEAIESVRKDAVPTGTSPLAEPSMPQSAGGSTGPRIILTDSNPPAA